MKVGDKVKVIDNQTEHHFKIGEIVTATHLDAYGGGTFENADNWWGMAACDFEPVTQLEPSKKDALDWQSIQAAWDESNQRNFTKAPHSTFEWFKAEISKQLGNV